MTKELVYQGSLIRIEQAGGEAVTPVADIAKAIGYDPRVLSKMVRRDPVLHLYEVSVTNPSQMPTGGYFQRKNNCLKKEGVAGLLVKLNSSRIKDAEKRDKVQAFQKWALTTLRQAMEDRLESPKAEQMSPEMAKIVVGVLQDVARSISSQTSAINNVVDMTYSLSARIDALEDKKKKNLKKEAKQEKQEAQAATREVPPTMDEFFQHRPENLSGVCRDVRNFLSMACQIDPDAATNLSYLYIVYENWSAANCQLPLGRNKFYDQIRDALAGYGDFVLNRAKLYVRGLRLKSVERV
jgi:hypothetical protein